MSNRQNGVKQKQVKSLAYRTRLGIFYVSLILWLESSSPEWCRSLAHRLRNFKSQCKIVGRRGKTLVLRLCGLRSSPSSIIAALERKMATIDREQENMPAVPACNWCRMGLHEKCEKKTKIHAFCVCDCERGY